MAGVLGIEPRSPVLETGILTAVLYPFDQYCNSVPNYSLIGET